MVTTVGHASDHTSRTGPMAGTPIAEADASLCMEEESVEIQ